MTLEDIASELCRLDAKEKEEWISTVMAKELPPELFLRAYGNENCKLSVGRFLEENGYVLAEFPDGKTEIRRGDAVIATRITVRQPNKNLFWNGGFRV